MDLKFLKGYSNFFLSFYLPPSWVPDNKIDPNYFDFAYSNKEETGRAHPLLISLAQTLVVNGKC